MDKSEIKAQVHHALSCIQVNGLHAHTLCFLQTAVYMI